MLAIPLQPKRMSIRLRPSHLSRRCRTKWISDFASQSTIRPRISPLRKAPGANPPEVRPWTVDTGISLHPAWQMRKCRLMRASFSFPATLHGTGDIPRHCWTFIGNYKPDLSNNLDYTACLQRYNWRRDTKTKKTKFRNISARLPRFLTRSALNMHAELEPKPDCLAADPRRTERMFPGAC